jgi:hypothetical protein
MCDLYVNIFLGLCVVALSFVACDEYKAQKRKWGENYE